MPPDELIPSNRNELSRRGDGINPITSQMSHDLLARSKETLDEIIAEAIDWLNTFRQGKVLYAPNEQSPYTGWAKAMWGNGQTQLLIQYKDGKMDGPSMQWHSNGQKSSELIRKDDKLITAVVWKPNGGKCPVTNVVDGNGVVVVYNEDGTEDRRTTYKDGEIVRD